MNTKRLTSLIALAIFVLAMVFGPLVMTPASAAPAGPSQKDCEAVTARLTIADNGKANIAHPEDSEWQSCFLSGWVNWVYSSTRPLPEQTPDFLVEPLKHGAFLQITEPWNAQTGAVNVGYLKLFGDWKAMMGFLGFGEINGVSGSWTDGSLWVANDFIMTSPGDQLTPEQAKAFCAGNIGFAFAYDGNHPLPTSEPCTGTTNTYFLREKWNGGCIGDQLPNSACNVGNITAFSTMKALTDYLKSAGWNRGSVWANRSDMQESAGISPAATAVPTTQPAATSTKIAAASATPTATKPVATTPTPTPTATSTATKMPATSGASASNAFDKTVRAVGGLCLGLFLLAVIVVVAVVLIRRRNRQENHEPVVMGPTRIDPEEINAGQRRDVVVNLYGAFDATSINTIKVNGMPFDPANAGLVNNSELRMRLPKDLFTDPGDIAIEIHGVTKHIVVR